jgi:hypothetical protein
VFEAIPIAALVVASGCLADTDSYGEQRRVPDEPSVAPSSTVAASPALLDAPVASTEASGGGGGSLSVETQAAGGAPFELIDDPILVDPLDADDDLHAPALDAGAGACGAVNFSVATEQACAIDVSPGMQLDGEGFIQVAGMDYRVFAMNRLGTGHVAAWCDGTTLTRLLQAYDLISYLAPVGDATKRVASVGGYPCQGPFTTAGGAPVTFWGTEIPAEYLDPETLAADWDVVAVCGHHIDWNSAWAGLLESFVSEHGKGLLLVMDYLGNATQTSGITPDDFTSLSAISEPAGFFFPPTNLPYASAISTVDLDCVPAAPGVPKAR